MKKKIEKKGDINYFKIDIRLFEEKTTEESVGNPLNIFKIDKMKNVDDDFEENYNKKSKILNKENNKKVKSNQVSNNISPSSNIKQ